MATIPLTNNLANQTDDQSLDYDQRGVGFPRRSGASVDIGAYEVQTARINDIVFDSTTWTRDPYSFASLVPQGRQLAPIFTERADTIEIHFTEDVALVTGNEVKLYRTPARYSNNRLAVPFRSFSYNPNTHVGTWTFDQFNPNTPYASLTAQMLRPDRYQIYIDPALVSSGNGLALNGDWQNLFGLPNGPPTLYDWRDDPIGRPLLSGTTGGSGTAFRFLFAYLPGDYDQNGIVDAGDQVVWADPYTSSDGNGDGISDKVHSGLANADFVVYNHYFGYAIFGTPTGDYNHDGRTDAIDYSVWRKTYGNTTGGNLDADGNGSGAVDTADYTQWRIWASTTSSTKGAWDLSAGGAGLGVEFSDSTSAPRVSNVTIKGHFSAHTPYSFATHVGSGEQLQTVPVGGADTISITFTEDVNVIASNLRTVGLRTFNIPTLIDFAYDNVTMTATWRFDDLIAFDQHLISLSDTITDTQGYRLDGEWVNPATTMTTNTLVSEFPSGDGHAGGKFNFVFTLLSGDADRNNLEGIEDMELIWAHWGAAGSGVSWTDGDLSGNQVVDGEDADIADLRPALGMYLDLTSTWIASDLNGDFVVDDFDANVLITNFGMSSATHAQGDLNGDGAVNVADLDLMFAQYGMGLSLIS